MIDENTKIKDLTNGQYSSLSYNAAGHNYSGPAAKEIADLIIKTGINASRPITYVGADFKDLVIRYQRANNIKETGVVDDALLHNIYMRATLYPNSIESDNEYDNIFPDREIYDAHYDPFFLNNSSKIYRKNHKDIIIEFGDGTNKKIIKDVFMRSVSVQVDTSGNPISEVYNFIARDIKESDALEDENKYIGEESNLSSSSDIKYSYETLFKDM